MDESVVRAMFSRSLRNASSSAAWSLAAPSSASLATVHASRKPWMMVMGWTFWLTRYSAWRRSSPAKTTTEVVPSPTSSSCALEMSTRTLAAALST